MNTSTSTNQQHGEHTMNTSPSHAATHAVAAPHARILKILKSGKSGFRLFTLALALFFAQTATAQTAAALPYTCDFENATERGNWTLENGTQTNKWATGTAAKNGGSYGLYISNDNGTSNAYTTGSTSYVYAWRALNFTVAGKYTVSFDWKSAGEASYDNLSAFLVPNATTITAGSSNTSGWIAVSGALNGQGNYWQSFSGSVTVPSIGAYKLVFFWRNDDSRGTQPPAAVDNISVTATYDISATALNSFGVLATPYTQPAAQTVTITNISTATGAITLTQPTSTNFTIGNLSTTTFAAGATATFTVRPKASLPVGTYSETITISGSNGALATVQASFGVVAAGTSIYVITGSGTSFTATKSGTTVGTANQPIQTVIDAVRTNANGAASAIQFGNGTVLDIGTEYITFNGTASPAWGAITLAGKITSALAANSNGTISLSNGASISSGADIANTAASSGRPAIYNNGSGTVTISGGTVSAISLYAVYNNSTGGILLSGDPTITGRIMKASTGILSVDNAFNPGSDKTYTLYFNNFQGVAVAGGASKIARFALASTTSAEGVNLGLSASGSDIVVSTTNGYAVAKSGTTYTITKGTGTFVSIQNAIDNIKTQANGAACTIQFGNGTTLDIGRSDATQITFDGSGTPTWGLITLTGSLTATSSALAGVIRLSTGTSIDSKANLRLGTDNGYLINNGGTLSISDGGVQTTYSTSRPIINSGTVTISGGTVSTSGSSDAVYNSGTVTISGGTVSATTGTAVNNGSATGKITVSGTAKVTSANVTATSGTIYNNSGSIEITGGTVENTAANTNARAIYNSSTGTVSISGGQVTAKTGYAIYRNDGTVNITGGVVFAHRASATSGTGDNVIYSSTAIDPSVTGLVVGWTTPATTNYTAFTSTNIAKLPAAATAQWLNKNGSGGIDYKNGTNMGFIPLAVTVNKMNPTVTFPTTAAITYNPATTLSAVPFVGGTGAGTFAWTAGTTIPTVTNSGYSVTFTPTDAANYNTATQTVAITVSKANPAVTFPTAATITYGAALSTSALSGGTGTGTFAWTTGTTIPTVTNSGYSVTFTPTDAANYNTLTQTVAITVNKATGTFGTPAAVNTTYTSTLKLSDLTLPANYVWNAPTTAITAAGNGQTFHATYTDPSGNYNSATGNITVNVAKAADLSATAPPNFMISVANTSPNTFDLSYIALNKSDHGALTYTLGAFANSGNILTAQPALSGTTLAYTGTGKTSGTATQVINIASDNYANATVTLTFEATPKTEVAIGGLTAQDYAYDGTPKRGVSGTATSGAYTGALEYIYAGTGIVGISTEPPANVGSYSLIVQVPETNANYTGYEIYAFTIDKAKISKPTAASNLAYTGTEQTGIAANAAYTIEGSPKATNAGNYTATVSLKDTDNYEWADGTDTDLELAWAIEKAQIAKPTVTTASLVYTGAAQSAGIAANSAYTITNGSATNAGNYTATVALSDKANREWADGTDTDLELAWAIAKANYDMNGISFADATVIYNGNVQSVLISGALPDGVNVSYTGNEQTAVGKYTITATFATTNANYNAPAPMTAMLTIDEASPIFTNHATPQIGGIIAKSANGAILLSNLPMNAKVEVYSLQGKRVYSTHSENSQILRIQVQTKGMYIIKAGSQSARVAVK